VLHFKLSAIVIGLEPIDPEEQALAAWPLQMRDLVQPGPLVDRPEAAALALGHVLC
jgi:hypothetical protein